MYQMLSTDAIVDHNPPWHPTQTFLSLATRQLPTEYKVNQFLLQNSPLIIKKIGQSKIMAEPDFPIESIAQEYSTVMYWPLPDPLPALFI